MAEDPKRRLAWPSYGRGRAERSGQEVKVLVEVADATGPAELPSEPIACGIAYLDHMLDQLNSHGQLRVSVQAWRAGQLLRPHSNAAFVQGCDSEVAELVGSALGAALRQMLDERRPSGSFRFLVPLDEALTDLSLDFSEASVEIALAPFGAFPPAGRQRIGSFRTALTEVILRRVAEELKVGLKVKKLRGDNAHHIVEATFKSFARCLRRAMDAASGLVNGGPRFSAAVLGERRVQKKRGTKETNIDISVDLDLSPETPERVATGFHTLDALLRRLGSGLQLTASCVGDAWIDEHHSVEDVMITVGQALHQALGSKAGCCRMAFAEAAYQSAQVLCVMDLSNRPMLCSDLQWQGQQEEMAEDVSVEMLHHAFESFVVNAAMTVHLVQVRPEGAVSPCALDLALAAAEAMGAALKQCVSIDVRRAGVTASSKGTLST